MPGPADAIEAYVLAKDGNQPWLMRRAFTDDAHLEMVVRTAAIDFPPMTYGRAAITDLLVRRFAQGNENVRTFCLAAPPREVRRRFTCDWLVGMSMRESGELRIGSGRYEWGFAEGPRALADHLRITIEEMLVLPQGLLPAMMAWFGSLSYPWCPIEEALGSMPPSIPLTRLARRAGRPASEGAV